MYLCIAFCFSLIMNKLQNKIVQNAVEKYMLIYQFKTKEWICCFIKSLFSCIINLFSLRLWYGILLFFFIYCIAFALYIIMTYVGGGVCYVIKKTIDTINWVAQKILLQHNFDIDVKEIDALAGLVDGTCDDFNSVSYTNRYWFSRILGNKLCAEMMWYETITLTKYFIAYPLKFLYVEVGTIPGQMCDLDMQWDMCAGVVGTMAWLNFMVEKGLWILLGLFIIGWPLTKYVLRMIKFITSFVIHEIHYQLYKIHPKYKSLTK